MILYGQTSSGKTYTLFGNSPTPNEHCTHLPSERTQNEPLPTANTIQNENGIVPRYLIALFEELQKFKDDPDFSFTLEYSFFEIYKEKIYDLINQTYDLVDIGNEKIKKVLKNLNLREKKENKVIIGRNLTERESV